MLIHVTETKTYDVLRSEPAECKTCHALGDMHLLRENRIVTTMFVISNTSVSHHLACARCKALYLISKHLLRELGPAPLAVYLARTGRREYPLMLRLLFVLWTMWGLMPIIGLIFLWKIQPYRMYFGHASRLYYRIMQILTLAVNAGWAYFMVTAINERHGAG